MSSWVQAFYREAYFSASRCKSRTGNFILQRNGSCCWCVSLYISSLGAHCYINPCFSGKLLVLELNLVLVQHWTIERYWDYVFQLHDHSSLTYFKTLDLLLTCCISSHLFSPSFASQVSFLLCNGWTAPKIPGMTFTCCNWLRCERLTSQMRGRGIHSKLPYNLSLLKGRVIWPRLAKSGIIETWMICNVLDQTRCEKSNEVQTWNSFSIPPIRNPFFNW